MNGTGWVAAAVALAVVAAGLGAWAWVSGWRVRLVWEGHGEPDDEVIEF